MGFSLEKIKGKGETLSSLYSRALIVSLLWDKIFQTQDVDVGMCNSPIFHHIIRLSNTVKDIEKSQRLIPGALESLSCQICYYGPTLGAGISTCSRKAFFFYFNMSIHRCLNWNRFMTSASTKQILEGLHHRIMVSNVDNSICLADWISVMLLTLELEWLLRNSHLPQKWLGSAWPWNPLVPKLFGCSVFSPDPPKRFAFCTIMCS